MGHPAPTSLRERLRGVESEIAAGRAEGALPRCQELATLYPRALAVQRVLGEIYLAMRKPREALAALDRALAGDPEDARACCARAIVHQMHGDQLAALGWYRRACDIRPDDASLRATYAEMAGKLGQPPYQPGRVGLARLYLRGDLFTHAIREWESLIAENSDSTQLEAHVGLVETLWRAGRLRDAEAWARRTLTNVPSCLKPLLIAGAIAHDEGRDADAEPFFRRATDLDPDHWTARALFSDRFATGDTALGKLLWGDTPPVDGSGGGPQGAAGTRATTSGQRVTAPAERRINRPFATGNGAPAAPRTRPDLTAPSAPLPPPTGHATDLPPGFQNMFKETENMLWDPGESDPGSAAAPPAPPAPRRAPFATPLAAAMEAMAPPPAIAESGFALGDTEMRRAIRWVQWLQAQGARSMTDGPQPSPPSGSLEALFNSPLGASQPAAAPPPAPPPVPPVTALPSAPSLPAFDAPALSFFEAPGMPASLPIEPLVAPLSMPSLPPFEPLVEPLVAPSARSAEPPSLGAPSGPLPPPSSADLRQMFAELDPGAPAREEANVVEADLASPEPPRAAMTGASRPDATIEELDRQGAADGFMPFDLEPGTLAALAGEAPPPHEARDAEPRPPAGSPLWPAAPEPAPYDAPYDAPAFEPAPEPVGPVGPIPQEPDLTPAASDPEPVAPPEPELLAPPPGPDPHDYHARLQQARDHRDTGAMDDAIVEYRTVVRNAPDLLPDVLADIEGCLTERPEHPELHRLLGDARIRQGDYLGALESYNRAVALSQTAETD